MREQRARLTDRHLLAFEVYGAVASRIVQDLHLVPLMFEIFNLRMTRTEARDFVGLLDLIHATRHPVKRDG